MCRYFPVKFQVVAPWHEDWLSLSHPDVDLVAVWEIIVRGKQAFVLIAQAADQMTFDHFGGLAGRCRFRSANLMQLVWLWWLLLNYCLSRCLMTDSVDQIRLLRIGTYCSRSGRHLLWSKSQVACFRLGIERLFYIWHQLACIHDRSWCIGESLKANRRINTHNMPAPVSCCLLGS